MESNRLVCTKRANDTVIMVGLLSLGVVVGASIAKKDGEELFHEAARVLSGSVSNFTLLNVILLSIFL